jgi:hypothetical protein
MADRVLAFDLATTTGWALLERGEPGSPAALSPAGASILGSGVLRPVAPVADLGDYPVNYALAAADLARQVGALYDLLVDVWGVVEVVIEEVNIAKARHSQKWLDWLHLSVTHEFMARGVAFGYIDSRTWREAVVAKITPEERKANARLSKAKSLAKKKGEKLDKKALGIKGKISKKHAALRVVNELFGLSLRPSDDDVADGICQALARLRGAPLSAP